MRPNTRTVTTTTPNSPSSRAARNHLAAIRVRDSCDKTCFSVASFTNMLPKRLLAPKIEPFLCPRELPFHCFGRCPASRGARINAGADRAETGWDRFKLWGELNERLHR